MHTMSVYMTLVCFFKSKSLKYVLIHIQKYTELYFWIQAKTGILYELTKF